MFIETPEGVVEIHRISNKRLKIKLPDSMTAVHIRERAFGRFVQEDDKGVVRPTYEMLEPTVGPDGELTGVHLPPVFHLAGAKP